MKLSLPFVMKNWPYHTWLVHYLTLKQFRRVFTAHVRKDGIVFDIGCSNKPYKALIERHCRKYFGLEHLSTIHDNIEADVIGTACVTSLKDCSVDTVFSAAVLEHLEEPSRAVHEMYRILKRQGFVILSAPLFWHIHEEPRDFYRYTRYGLEHLLKSNGFEIAEIKALAGFWVTFTEMIINYLRRFNRGILRFIPIIPFAIIAAQAAAYLLNRIEIKGENWTWAYVAVARKP